MEKPKCIIIDDEVSALKRQSQLIKKTGLAEVIATEDDPEKAVGLVIRLRPDLVFIDVEMPHMNGFEVIEQIRSNHCNPVFIFVTAYNQYAIKAIRTAAFDYILKPVQIDELTQALSHYLNNVAESFETRIKNHPGYKKLTAREKEILQYITEGQTSRMIARKLFISKNTVDTHRRHILDKMGVDSTLALLSKNGIPGSTTTDL